MLRDDAAEIHVQDIWNDMAEANLSLGVDRQAGMMYNVNQNDVGGDSQ